MAGVAFEPFLRPGTADESFWRGSHDDNSFGLPERFEPDDIVVDLGAAIGSVSRLALERGAGKVLAYEIDRDAIQLCYKNLYGFSNAYVGNYAVVGANRSTFVEYEIDSSSLWHKGTRKTLVPTITLDKIVNGQRIRFLKINIEGAEWEVLYTTAALDTIEEIAGQFHERGPDFPTLEGDPNLPPYTVEAMRAYLDEWGFDLEVSGPDPGHSVYNFHARKRRVVRHEDNPNYSLGN